MLQSAYKTFEKNNKNEYVPSIVVKGTLCEDYRKELLKVPMFVCQRFQAGGLKECPFKKVSVNHGNQILMNGNRDRSAFLFSIGPIFLGQSSMYSRRWSTYGCGTLLASGRILVN